MKARSGRGATVMNCNWTCCRRYRRLVGDEQVFWRLPARGFQFPPPGVRKGIDKAAREAKIDLHIAER